MTTLRRHLDVKTGSRKAARGTGDHKHHRACDSKALSLALVLVLTVWVLDTVMRKLELSLVDTGALRIALGLAPRRLDS